MGKASAPMSISSKDSKLCARVDISKASQAGDVELGEQVTITITGKVKALRGPDNYIGTDYGPKGKEIEVERSMPGSIEVEISSMEVKPVGALDGMLDD